MHLDKDMLLPRSRGSALPSYPLGISVRTPRCPVVMKGEFEKGGSGMARSRGFGSTVTTVQLDRRQPG